MNPKAIADSLESFNRWRTGEDGVAEPVPAEVTNLIDAAIAHLRQPAPTAQNDERQLFESAMRARWPNVALGRLQQNPELYESSQVQTCWQSWQDRAAIATAQAAAGVPVGAIHKDTLAMLPNLRTFDGGAKLWPTSKAEYDTDYVLVFAAPSAPAQSDSADARDAARLDWLDRQAEAYGFQETHEGNKWEIGGAYRTVRDAIDAAIAASAAKGEQPCE